MANDCSTTYKIVGETTELQAIYQVLKTCASKKVRMASYWRTLWIISVATVDLCCPVEAR